MNIIVGFLTGVAASMGLGGGFILILYLTAFCGVSQIAAGGINLLFFLPVSAVSLIIHLKNKLVCYKILLPICLAGALGVIGGTFLSGFLDDKWLGRLFAGLLIFVGIRELFHKKADDNSEKSLDKSKNIEYNEAVSKYDDRE